MRWNTQATLKPMFLKNVLLLGVVGKIMALQRYLCPYSRACDYINLHGERDLAEFDVIKNIEMEDYPGFFGWVRWTQSLLRERQKGPGQRK